MSVAKIVFDEKYKAIDGDDMVAVVKTSPSMDDAVPVPMMVETA